MAESGERETGSNAGWIVIGVLGLVALLVIGFFALDVFIGRQ